MLGRERSKLATDKDPAPPRSPPPVGRSPRAARARAAQAPAAASPRRQLGTPREVLLRVRVPEGWKQGEPVRFIMPACYLEGSLDQAVSWEPPAGVQNGRYVRVPVTLMSRLCLCGGCLPGSHALFVWRLLTWLACVLKGRRSVPRPSRLVCWAAMHVTA